MEREEREERWNNGTMVCSHRLLLSQPTFPTFPTFLTFLTFLTFPTFLTFLTFLTFTPSRYYKQTPSLRGYSRSGLPRVP
jgi:hypothetical protein